MSELRQRTVGEKSGSVGDVSEDQVRTLLFVYNIPTVIYSISFIIIMY